MSAKTMAEVKAVREAQGNLAEKLAENYERAATRPANENEAGEESGEPTQQPTPTGPTLRATDGVDELLAGTGTVDASRIEAPGIIVDPYSGKTWAVPTDANTDTIGLSMHRSPYAIKKDPNFHYEFHGVDELAEYMSQDFVPVTRRELGLDTGLTDPKLSKPLDEYYVVKGTDICLKIPRQLAALRYKELKRVCDAAVEQTKAGRYTRVEGSGDDARLDTKELLARSDDVVQIKREQKMHSDSHEPTREELN